jgi:hypothetical protein
MKYKGKYVQTAQCDVCTVIIFAGTLFRMQQLDTEAFEIYENKRTRFEKCTSYHPHRFTALIQKAASLGLISSKYEGRLQSSWTHLITPSQNFVEVR